MTNAAAVLEVRGLAKSYRTRRGTVQAFTGVDLEIERGETVALVGESGCGKTSLAKTIYRLLEADAGSIRIKGTDVTRLRRPAMRPHRRIMQMVFQDPYGSLNPRATVGRILEEPLIVHGLGSATEGARASKPCCTRSGSAKRRWSAIRTSSPAGSASASASPGPSCLIRSC